MDDGLSGRTQSPFAGTGPSPPGWQGAPLLLPFLGLPTGPGPVWARRESRGPGTRLDQKPQGGEACAGRGGRPAGLARESASPWAVAGRAWAPASVGGRRLT